MLPFKNPIFEGLTGLHVQGTNGHGRRYKCADFEMNYVECLEAYGLSRGFEECKKWYDDYRECKYNRLSVMRRVIMDAHHVKKLVKGERDWDKKMGEPYAYDAYIAGTFWP